MTTKQIQVDLKRIGTLLQKLTRNDKWDLCNQRLELRTKRGPSEDYKLVLHKYKRDASSIAIYWWATRFAQFVPHLVDFHRACASYSMGTCCLFLSLFFFFLFFSPFFFLFFSLFFTCFSLCQQLYNITI